MAEERKKGAESTKKELEEARADIRAGKQQTPDPTTSSPSTSTANKACPPPYNTKPPSRPLSTTPDEMKAKLTHRERMIQEEIAEIDQCFAMMQQQEKERASTRVAQEAAAIYTDESLHPSPAASGPSPAYHPPSPSTYSTRLGPVSPEAGRHHLPSQGPLGAGARPPHVRLVPWPWRYHWRLSVQGVRSRGVCYVLGGSPLNGRSSPSR